MASFKAFLVVLALCLTQTIGTPSKRRVETSPDLAPLKKSLGEGLGNLLQQVNRANESNDPSITTLVNAIKRGQVQYKGVLPLLPNMQGLSPNEQLSTILNNINSAVPENQAAIQNLRAQLVDDSSALNTGLANLGGSSPVIQFQTAISNTAAQAIDIQNSGISLETGDLIQQVNAAVDVVNGLTDLTTTVADFQAAVITDQSNIAVSSGLQAVENIADLTTTNAIPQTAENAVDLTTLNVVPQIVENTVDLTTTNAAPQTAVNTNNGASDVSYQIVYTAVQPTKKPSWWQSIVKGTKETIHKIIH